MIFYTTDDEIKYLNTIGMSRLNRKSMTSKEKISMLENYIKLAENVRKRWDKISKTVVIAHAEHLIATYVDLFERTGK